ncbi:MAG: hypothetical protein ACREFA_03490 [Stellaceae bacterium]
MGDFLRFETMITPVLIQVIFWLAVVIAIIAGIVRIGHGGAGGIAEGIALIILGPILARIYAESSESAMAVRGASPKGSP